MSAGQQLDFVVDDVLREKILWQQQVLTMPGAEMVSCLDTAYVHLSQHASGAATADGQLHAMGRGLPRCFHCHCIRFQQAPMAPIHKLQQRSQDLLSELASQLEAARLTHKAIT